MKKTLALTSPLLLLLSCFQQGTVEQRIGAQVLNCAPSTPCIVRIRELTDFQWDQMHVFDYGASLDEIQKTLGTDYSDFVEFRRRMVFLQDGRIVHREDEPTDIERPVNGEVSFAELAQPLHASYTPETAVFRAEKKTVNGGVYYSLTRVEYR